MADRKMTPAEVAAMLLSPTARDRQDAEREQRRKDLAADDAVIAAEHEYDGDYDLTDS